MDQYGFFEFVLFHDCRLGLMPPSIGMRALEVQDYFASVSPSCPSGYRPVETNRHGFIGIDKEDFSLSIFLRESHNINYFGVLIASQ